MRRKPAAPLPVRDGLNPTRLRLPAAGPWTTVLEYLQQRFPDDRVRLAEKAAAGEIVDADGRPVNRFAPGLLVHLYRDPPVEVPIPFDIPVLHRDDNLLVVDKPHFVASTPRGAHVTESALVRLRCRFAAPELSPMHRLDRLTAGVLVFTVRAGVRGAYQRLFDTRQVRKVYEATAAYDPALALPRTVRSRIEKRRGVLAAQQVAGPGNSETRVELLRARGGVADYRLLPRTGRTHQLRVHLNALGVPIVHDPLYPVVRKLAADDYAAPLQLLARSVTFTDPYTGATRCFESRRRLGADPFGG